MEFIIRKNSFDTCGGIIFNQNQFKDKIANCRGRNTKQIIFTSILPQNKRGIDWKESVGYYLPFKYDDICGCFEILDYKQNENKRGEILIRYDNDEEWVPVWKFSSANIGTVIGKTRKPGYLFEIEETINVNNNKLLILDRRTIRGNTKKRRQYFVECLTCHDKKWKSEEAIIASLNNNGCGCNICAGHECLPGFNDITIKAPWMIQYFQGGEDEARNYTPSSNSSIYPICPFCGQIYDKKIRIYSIYKNKGFGCKCKKGWPYGERLVGEVLDQNNINYLHDIPFEWSNGRRYDFYLLDYKIIIEVDGEIGHGFYQPWKSYEQSEEEFRIDEIKDATAYNNGINWVFRLVYLADFKNEFCDEIKNGLPEFLWKKTNWEQATENIQKNIYKEICIEYENSDKSSNIINYICEKYHYSKTTIREILKLGNEYGWCKY